MRIYLHHGGLYAQDQPLLKSVPQSVTPVADLRDVGVFLRFTAELPASLLIFDVGKMAGVKRWLSLHRFEPFWMVPEPRVGRDGQQVPIETQFLLVERENGSFGLFVPLIDHQFAASLQGTEAGDLQLVAESGDVSVVSNQMTGLFVAVGDNPYTLIDAAAASVNEFIGVGKLRADKKLPPFADKFGWCTWDAFYTEVSHEKVRQGLESFRAGGVQPKFMILDDGWHSVKKRETGQAVLTSFAANEKFPGGLKPTVDMTKGEFGIEAFLVWHAMTGYWGGLDVESLPGYDVKNVRRQSLPGTKHYSPKVDEYWGPEVGLVSPQRVGSFFDDFHAHLKNEGVDGVKCDNQASLETVADGLGGRVTLMHQYHDALEASVNRHFAGNLINCMSCSAEMIYGASSSLLTRSSIDFWPDKRESHGLHLYTNAFVSLWLGQFIHPDWDMFQSGHELGSYHAAGRAVGGCPVYVSDKPGHHNFDLLRELVLSDGSVLRCERPGRPTRDCLFHDPTTEDVLLKIFNLNRYGGVIGAFNARYNPAGRMPPIAGTVSPSDVHALPGDRFAVYAHNAGKLTTLDRLKSIEIKLGMWQWELFTVMPIRNGFAAIGLSNMLNSGGAITDMQVREGQCRVELRDGGRFVAYCQRQPKCVRVNEAPAKSIYEEPSGMCVVDIPRGRPVGVQIAWE